MQGDVLAQHNPGCCYDGANGVAKDVEQACKRPGPKPQCRTMLRRSAIWGDCYRKGDGVAQDHEKAAE